MGVFNDDIVSLPEINADIIREVSRFVPNSHRSHEELMEIINTIVHSIYYNAKLGMYPDKGEWTYEGRIFGIPHAYSGLKEQWKDKVTPPSIQNMFNQTEDTINYIQGVFEQLGFNFEYIAEKDDEVLNIVIIRIPFKTKNFESFAQQVFSKTIAADIIPVQAMSPPNPNLMFMDFPYNTNTGKHKKVKSNYGSI